MVHSWSSASSISATSSGFDNIVSNSFLDFDLNFFFLVILISFETPDSISRLFFSHQCFSTTKRAKRTRREIEPTQDEKLPVFHVPIVCSGCWGGSQTHRASCSLGLTELQGCQETPDASGPQTPATVKPNNSEQKVVGSSPAEVTEKTDPDSLRMRFSLVS